MTTSHQRRAIEWWLHAHAIAAPEATTLIRPEHYQPVPKKTIVIEEPDGPTGYDTALSTDEGLWLRHGWAGRG